MATLSWVLRSKWGDKNKLNLYFILNLIFWVDINDLIRELLQKFYLDTSKYNSRSSVCYMLMCEIKARKVKQTLFEMQVETTTLLSIQFLSTFQI